MTEILDRQLRGQCPSPAVVAQLVGRRVLLMGAFPHFAFGIMALALTSCASKPPHAYATESCPANLKQIQGAKQMWALEHRKRDTEVPTDADLFGVESYIREKPACPQGGTYTFGTVVERVRCSVPGHTL